MMTQNRYNEKISQIREALKNKPYDEVLGAAQFTELTMSKAVIICHKLSLVVISCHKLS